MKRKRSENGGGFVVDLQRVKKEKIVDEEEESDEEDEDSEEDQEDEQEELISGNQKINTVEIKREVIPNTFANIPIPIKASSVGKTKSMEALSNFFYRTTSEMLNILKDNQQDRNIKTQVHHFFLKNLQPMCLQLLFILN